MDTKELKKAKTDLEYEIAESIRGRLENFKQETGLTVSGVDLNFTYAPSCSKEFATHFLSGASVRIDL